MNGSNSRALLDVRRSAVLRSAEYSTLLFTSAQAIRSVAESGANEATISQEFDARLKHVMSELEFDYTPSKEESAVRVRNRNRGRMDTRLGNLVVEFKQPATMRRNSDRDNAVKQLRDYLDGLYEVDQAELVGFLTDGVDILRISRSSSGFSQGAFRPLTGESLREYADWLLSLERTALTGRNLVSRFHEDDGPVYLLARSFYARLSGTPGDRATMLFREWQRLFKLAHDDRSQQQAIEDRRLALERAMGVSFRTGDRTSEYAALFSLQTAFAVVVKLIAYKVLSGVRYSEATISLARFSEITDVALGSLMARIEDGAGLREEGFTNLLEGDFFSWYSHESEWDTSIAANIRDVLFNLSEFEDSVFSRGALFEVQDLFKELYEAVIPEKVRHSLGEFYTPAWLADHTVEKALETASVSLAWRGIDPCCGSGTFLTVMLSKLLAETIPPSLADVLTRVVGIDLNPLAVLMARVNYFANISHLIGQDDEFEIPVYLGDASRPPVEYQLQEVTCLRYVLETDFRDVEIVVPKSALRDLKAFSETMTRVENATASQNEVLIASEIESICDPRDLTAAVKEAIRSFSSALVDLERNNWDGIWARVAANFFATAGVGRFEIVVGNPPWIDWKNLPENYRASLVASIGRKLFSGDGITGGVNLNVCAVIAHAAANNWLSDDGVLAFLMPETILYQQTYEGFRKLPSDPGRPSLAFRALVDWTKSGHPFAPVTQPFFTYVIAHGPAHAQDGVPVETVQLKKQRGTRKFVASSSSRRRFDDVAQAFDIRDRIAITPETGKNYFVLAEDRVEADSFRNLPGATKYRGREGIEFYPQELLLFEWVAGRSRNAGGRHSEVFANYQGSGSKHFVPPSEHRLETEYLRPLVKGVDVGRFHLAPTRYFVPFAYETEFANGRSPLPPAALAESSPLLLAFFQRNRAIFDAQTKYNSRIIGPRHDTEFYGLARVGEYSHAERFVVFRDNSSWQATVVEATDLPWGGSAVPVFQNHAVSISEGPDGALSDDEAHYVCGFLNAPVVGRFVLQSSDSRTFPIRLRVAVPPFDAANADHMALADLSRRAHSVWADENSMADIDKLLDHAVAGAIAASA